MFECQHASAVIALSHHRNSKLKSLFFQKARKGRKRISAMQAIIRNFLCYFS